MSGTSLKKNTTFNIIGAVTPMVLSLVTVPIFLKYIGEERFGVLALVWLLVGYFGVFDFGLARTTANQIAKMRNEPAKNREAVFWTALWLNASLGVLGGGLLYFVADPLMSMYFKMPDQLRPEITATIFWVAVSVPVATLTGVVLGGLEGKENFAVANTIQIVGMTMVQLAPLFAYWIWGSNLEYLVPSIVVARILSGLFLVVALVKILPISSVMWIDRSKVSSLLGYGFWVSVSSFISPMLESFDRIFIGAMVGAKSVAHYSVPFNIVDKLRVFPRAIGRAIFPRLSQNDSLGARELTVQSVGVMVYLMTLAVAPFIPLVNILMELWLGKDFATHSIIVAQILLLGIWANSPAVAPLLFLQSQGRPDAVAKLHLMEFFPFLAVLWISIKFFGIEGAAIAWTLRVMIDALLLYWRARIIAEIKGKLLIGAAFVCISFGVSVVHHAEIFVAIIKSLVITCFVGFWILKKEPELSRLVFEKFKYIFRGKS